MLSKYKYFLLFAIIFFLVLGFMNYEKLTKLFRNETFAGTQKNIAASETTAPQAMTECFCPQVEDIIKKNDMWVTKDGKWKSFTSSTATAVVNFLGAQWVGIKVGKIICLYQTNEAVSFPLAMEQLSSQIVPAPLKGGWSALVDNRKFCKSANIADCSYLAETPKEVGDVYQEIKYNPNEAKE